MYNSVWDAYLQSKSVDSFSPGDTFSSRQYVAEINVSFRNNDTHTEKRDPG
jgi:hypothetical protein